MKVDFAAEYDVRAQIPGFEQVINSWTARSQAVQHQLPGRVDVAYGDSPDETLDYFSPAGVTKPPLLVFLHGGFWRKLHKDDFAWIAPPYLDEGVAVAVINYGLAPATNLETIVEQIRKSIAWLYLHADQLGFDTDRITVSGHSAGGHLTCMAMATDWMARDSRLPADLLAAGIALSPVVDLTPLKEVPMLENDLHFTPERIATLSPCLLHPATAAPVIGSVGGLESNEFKRQRQILAESWSGVWKGAVDLPDRDHLTLCEAFAEPDSELFVRSLALIKQP